MRWFIKIFTICALLCMLVVLPVYAENGDNVDAAPETVSMFDIMTKMSKANADDKNNGTLRISAKVAGTGEGLTDCLFFIYDKDNNKVGEILTQSGEAKLSLSEGEYILYQEKVPEGFKQEEARIAFSISNGEETSAEITNEVMDISSINPQEIIPKTGETSPEIYYILFGISFLFAILCGIRLLLYKFK